MVEPETKFVRLSSGRRLAYAEFGAEAGLPVIFHHGAPSCRLEAQAYGRGAWLRGVRLIAVDRPGIGRSDWDPEWTFVSFAEMIREFAGRLGLEKFGLLGVSGGGPPSLACASAFPERITKVAIAAGAPYGGLDRDIVARLMSGVDYLGAQIAWRWPRLLPALFGPLGWLARRGPASLFRLLLMNLPPADRAAVQSHGLEPLLLRCVRESFLQGGRGTARETLLHLRPWGFPIEEIQTPVTIWQGAADTLVEPALQLLLSQRIPGAGLQLFPGEGHFVAVPRAPEFLSIFSDITL